MNRNIFVTAAVLSMIALLSLVAGIALAADPPKAPEMPLPPGWTADDMQACVLAATPGDMHKWLADGAGTWKAKNTMWMFPDAAPVTSESKSVCAMIMDGRFMKVDATGDMPGMGPFSGMGLYGYDVAKKKFVCMWLDNQTTGLMDGTGELSADKKVITWKYNYMCPVAKKMSVMREVDTRTGPDTMTIEMYTVEPKSGKEYKMMLIEQTRQK